MENNVEEDGALEEGGQDQAGGRRSEDGEAGGTAACVSSRAVSKVSDFLTHMLPSTERLGNPDESVSPVLDTCDPSTSSLSSTSTCSSSSQHIEFPSSSSSSSSCGSILSLSPPLPPSVELSDVLTDTRLTLDVYPGGASALPLLWGSIPEQLRGLQYLRLGSEEKPGLDGAVDVLPHLTALRSLTIRGT